MGNWKLTFLVAEDILSLLNKYFKQSFSCMLNGL